MLTIRKKQMDALSEYMLKQFEDRMVLHLQSTFPEETKDLKEENLRAMINAGVKKSANCYGVEDEVDVERFLECMVRYGPDFDTKPQTSWASRILRDEDLSGTEKMNEIDEHELFVLREESS